MVKKLTFRDLTTGESFTTSKFELVTGKKGRKRAVAVSPSGTKTSLFVKKDFKKG